MNEVELQAAQRRSDLSLRKGADDSTVGGHFSVSRIITGAGLRGEAGTINQTCWMSKK